MKKIPLINSFLLLVLICTGLYFIMQMNKPVSESYVYVDNVVLFNEFNMSKDLKSQEEKKLSKLKTELDSLFVVYNKIEDKKSKQISVLEQTITSKNQEFAKIQENFTEQLSQQIWNRLNGYVKEYSEMKNYKIIFGTNGTGNIMYANEAVNITSNFLKFANNKYEGIARLR